MQGRTRGARLVAAVAVAGACVAVAAVMFGSTLMSTRTDGDTSGEDDPVASASNIDPVATVTAVAAKGAAAAITSVDCPPPLGSRTVLIVTCAVTFEGPASQLWSIGGADDPEPLPLGDPTPGKRGSVDEETGITRCA